MGIVACTMLILAVSHPHEQHTQTTALKDQQNYLAGAWTGAITWFVMLQEADEQGDEEDDDGIEASPDEGFGRVAGEEVITLEQCLAWGGEQRQRCQLSLSVSGCCSPYSAPPNWLSIVNVSSAVRRVLLLAVYTARLESTTYLLACTYCNSNCAPFLDAPPKRHCPAWWLKLSVSNAGAVCRRRRHR